MLAARSPTREAAEHGIARMRFALGVDEDLRPFLARFARRPADRPLALAPALAASGAPRRSLRGARLGDLRAADRVRARRRDRAARAGGARAPLAGGGAGRRRPARPAAASVLAGTAPARLQSFDLSASRAVALVRVAREVASGRVDLSAREHERGWRRLRAIPGVGAWTVEMLALHGQGRHDQVPAGDVGLLKLVGRLLAAATRGRAPRSTRSASSSPPTESGRASPPRTSTPV